MSLQLHDYWRSSASYRVRIGLGLKGLAAERCVVDLSSRRHQSPGYRDLNPQALVPTLIEDGFELGQSLAILEYIDETYPAPAFFPADRLGRGVVRWMALLMACDIHPLANLRVLNALRTDFSADEAAVSSWARRWIEEGLAALETLARVHSADGTRCYGRSTSLADICLVPQLYSARRFGCALDRYPLLCGIDTHLQSLQAFAGALPERQADAPVAAR